MNCRRVSLGLALSVIAPILAYGQTVRVVTEQLPVLVQYSQGALVDDGDTAYLDTTLNPAGGDPLSRNQIVRFDLASGQATQVSAFDDGVVSGSTAVSDDGQWLALLSASDPLATNADGSVELFVMQPGGSQLAQLTHAASPSAGTLFRIALAGSANRILFVGNTDPLGTNPSGLWQLFAIDRDGTGLTQLTDLAVSDIGLEMSISDDGLRVAFSSWGDLTSGNADGSRELFAVDADGTNLRQLTSATSGFTEDPWIAGNGATIAFVSDSNLAGLNLAATSALYVIDWSGTGLQQLTNTAQLDQTWAYEPSISDDATTIFFSYDPSILGINTDVWRIQSDGTALTQLTTSDDGIGDPVVSGDSSRVLLNSWGVFAPGINDDGGSAVISIDDLGGNVELLVERESHFQAEPDITPDGGRVVFISDRYDPTTNPGRYPQVFRRDSGDAEPTQVTAVTDGDVGLLAGITGNGNTVVFAADADPLGTNPNNNIHVFAIDSDGSNLRQLSDGNLGSIASYPTVARDGSWVVFQSDGEYINNKNTDHSPELFRVSLTGASIRQLTEDDDHRIKRPRLDGVGEWVVYQSTSDVLGTNPDGRSEIFRVRTDGKDLEQLTDDALHASDWPDISDNGARIVYRSSSDPLGTNPEHNGEIFLLAPDTPALLQLTVTTTGDSTEPRLSGDGSFVFFKSSAPFFETPVTPGYDAYRVQVASGAIERISGLHDRPLYDGGYRLSFAAAPDLDGDTGVFTGGGNRNGDNPDRSEEVWLADFNAPSTISVGQASPTVVSWTADPQPLRYDVVRGDVAALQDGGLTVDLGPVLCVENDSVDNTTVGDEDPGLPFSGQAFFYVRRGTQGNGDPNNPGSYGTGTGGKERTGGSGDCSP